jgi:hypothetical protein
MDRGSVSKKLRVFAFVPKTTSRAVISVNWRVLHRGSATTLFRRVNSEPPTLECACARFRLGSSTFIDGMDGTRVSSRIGYRCNIRACVCSVPS